ncbi:MAG TPA: ubiquinol-cytochrome c reductase iron-sulfur subunit [Bryobacteraceae bacterium]|nr:ubiquinol-cytochrome c reductase iron-sulfur subunit [Bryobacteraceae bacterium]
MPQGRLVSTANGTTRRHFYVGAIYATWAVITAALGIPALFYLFLPPKIRERQEWTEVGSLSNLATGAPVEMAFRQNRIDGWKIISEKSTAWVVKQTDNSVVAFGPQCTHLGCAYHWDDAKHEFLCPCHNSVFAMDGQVISGPAPRPLDRYDVKVNGNTLLVGKLHQEQS